MPLQAGGTWSENTCRPQRRGTSVYRRATFDIPPPSTMTSGSSTLITDASERARRSSYRERLSSQAPRSPRERAAAPSASHGRGPGPDLTDRSRYSLYARSSSPDEASQPPPAPAAGCGPTPPRSRSARSAPCRPPRSPPPTPVPRITPNTTFAPRPAPSTASDRAKQLASFAMRTSLPRSFSRSCLKGLPISHVELAPFTKPVAGEREPGIPIPTVPSPASRTKEEMASSVA